MDWFETEQIFFAPDGTIFLAGWTDISPALFAFDAVGQLMAQWQIRDVPQGIIALADGPVVALFQEQDSFILRELDPFSETWGEKFAF